MRRRLRRSLWPRGRLSGCPVGSRTGQSPSGAYQQRILYRSSFRPVPSLLEQGAARELLAVAKIAREQFDPRLSHLDVGVVGAEDPLLVGQQRGGQAQRTGRRPRPARSNRRCCCGWSGCRGGRGRRTRCWSGSSAVTGAMRRGHPRPARSSRRCCCGWSGCRGDRGRGPAAGRAAAR